MNALYLILFTVALYASPVFAQFGGGPVGGQQPNQQPEKELVVKQAPEENQKSQVIEDEPTIFKREKRYELIELDGMFRFRTDWFKNFNLGFNDDPTVGGAPFRRPLACTETAGVSKPCEETLKSANMRLRLHPKINLSETTSIHFDVDILDNLVLGSTPDGTFFDGTPSPTNIPISGFSGGQVTPQAGRNSLTDSIAVKRAWAEILTPLGKIKVGRMPSHWGLGLLANSGDKDTVHGTYDTDGDYGDTADRLLFGTKVPGAELTAAIAMDWASTRPTAAQTDIFLNRYDGQAWDLDDNDDVNQWVFVLGKFDSPEKFDQKVAQGEFALNYGGYLVYRTQNFDYNPSSTTIGSPPDDTAFVPRNAKAFIPDLWVRMAKGHWNFEFEGVGVFGSIEDLSDLGISDELTVRQLGAVAKTNYGLMNGKLRLGAELGYASGDQWDNSPQGSTNVRDARALPGPGDTTVSAFRFDFDYKVDMILFRELLGTVTNATYVKPTVSFDYSRFTFNSAMIWSFANVPVATPGNGRSYGVELNFDLGYRSDYFSAGIAYGVLFPLSAMDHPEDDIGQGGPGFGYGTNAGDAKAAQTIQTRLVLSF